jgi:hypothetical protein
MKLLMANVIAFAGFALAVSLGAVHLGSHGAAAAQVVFEALAIFVAASQYASSLRRKQHLHP